jgi:hypothetical protein
MPSGLIVLSPGAMLLYESAVTTPGRGEGFVGGSK